jgi:hypothetical protein
MPVDTSPLSVYKSKLAPRAVKKIIGGCGAIGKGLYTNFPIKQIKQ